MNVFEQPGYSEGSGLRRIQVVFVIDTSNSMATLIGELRDAIADISEIYSNFRMKSEFQLVEFRHIATDGPLRRITEDWIEDSSIFSRMVSELEATGGGPFKESINEALILASNSKWDKARSTSRVIVLATDSKPDQSSVKIAEVKDHFTVAGIDQFYYFVDPNFEDEYLILCEAENRSGNPITPCLLRLVIPLNGDDIRRQFREFAEHSGYSVPENPGPESDDFDADEQSGDVVGL